MSVVPRHLATFGLVKEIDILLISDLSWTVFLIASAKS